MVVVDFELIEIRRGPDGKALFILDPSRSDTSRIRIGRTIVLVLEALGRVGSKVQ